MIYKVKSQVISITTQHITTCLDSIIQQKIMHSTAGRKPCRWSNNNRLSCLYNPSPVSLTEVGSPKSVAQAQFNLQASAAGARWAFCCCNWGNKFLTSGNKWEVSADVFSAENRPRTESLCWAAKKYSVTECHVKRWLMGRLKNTNTEKISQCS